MGYRDIFRSISKLYPNGILLGFFFLPYSGHIEDTKSVEFASIAICSRLTPIYTLLYCWKCTLMFDSMSGFNNSTKCLHCPKILCEWLPLHYWRCGELDKLSVVPFTKFT